jgi:protease II
MMSASSETSEVHILYLGGRDGSTTMADLQVVASRSPKALYDIDVRGSMLYIQTNLNAPNCRVMIAPLATLEDDTEPAAERWQQLECVRPDVCREAFGASETVTVHTLRAFSHHLVVEGREHGVSRVWILSLTADDRVESILDVVVPIDTDDMQSAPRAGDEENSLATLSLDVQQDADAGFVRLIHSSLTSPERLLECVWPTPSAAIDGKMDLRVVKLTHVPGFNAHDYHSWRLWAPAAVDSDVLIPTSCVQRRRPAGAVDTPGPMLLYGYGSYGEFDNELHHHYIVYNLALTMSCGRPLR